MIYIIGDVHGCYETLLALIKKLPKNARIVFVGDLIDRGPKSKDVIRLVKHNGYDCVLGNHEDLMLDADGHAIDKNLNLTGWGGNGGDVCEREYKGHRDAIESDMAFLSTLPYYIIYDDIVDDKGRKLIVTHAPIVDNLDLYFKSKEALNGDVSDFERIDHEHMVGNIEESMIWNRNIPKKGHPEYFNVFGHTPIDSFVFNKDNEFKIEEKFITPERVVVNEEIGFANIDSGAVYTKKKRIKYRGRLTALEFPSLRVIQQENIDDCEPY